MKSKIAATMKKNSATFIISAFVFLISMAPAIAEDAFSILDKLEKNYVGLEKEGLNTLTATASVSIYPKTTIMVYWLRDKGLKVKAKEDSPAAMGAGPMVQGYIGAAGLGLKKSSVEYKLTKETVDASIKTVTLKDGTKAKEIIFIPKKDQGLNFKKLIMTVDTNKWLVGQFVTTAKEGETTTDMTYEGNLLVKMVSSAGKAKTTIASTYTKKDKFNVPVNQVIEMEGPDIPKEMKNITVTYSDTKVNAKIPDDVFAEPKPGDVPKPTETAAELFQQAQAAMRQGDMNTAKLKLKQIITYYPDDSMAMPAKMMLKQLPE